MKAATKALNLGLVALVCFFFGTGFAHADNLFVANADVNTIEEFNSSGVGTAFVSSGLMNPTGLAFDSAGNLCVATGNAIKKFNSSGVGTVWGNSGSVLFDPNGLAFDNDGNLYVANDGNNKRNTTGNL
jgi:secreted PhoX family phosphatase